MPYRFIESPNVTARQGRSIAVVVIHTMEIAERRGAALACARWFADPRSEVSAHYCVDAETTIQCVLEENIAWHARGGNTHSIGIELAGFARQEAPDWADEFSAAVLARGAHVAAEVCARYAIPIQRIRSDGLRAGRRGITGHADVSVAFGKSDHWDPGPGFPWRRFLRLARGGDVVERASQT